MTLIILIINAKFNINITESFYFDKMENLVWFSHFGTEYEVKEKDDRKVVQLKGTKIFNWDNCNIQISPSPVKKLRIYVRSYQHVYSKYKRKIVRQTFLLIVDVDSISMPYEDLHQIGSDRESLKSLQNRTYPRYVFKIDDYWIWEWKKTHDITQSSVYVIYERIKAYLDHPTNHKGADNIIVHDSAHHDRDVIPVIYQPAIDALDNFVREIHCSRYEDNKTGSMIEVSIMFNNEQLRRHKIVNSFYEKFRLFFYGRNIDVETFCIRLPSEKLEDMYFTFKGIYSAHFGIEEDSIHGDARSPPPRRNVSIYFVDYFHPVVFINTSNHAMAEKDNNAAFWKWEYQPFDQKPAITYGTQSREEIDNKFKSVFERYLSLKGTYNYQLVETQKWEGMFPDVPV